MPPADDTDVTPAGERVGRRIANRYILRSILGRGAHGEVWEAEDTLGQTIVAVKLLRPEKGLAASQIRREVAVLRLLRIPGVVQLLDEGLDDGQPFLLMERIIGTPIPGTSERTWSAIEGPTLALLETLDRVHAAGIVHRDIKPGNVLVDGRGVPTLLDFGVSLGISLAREPNADERLTGTPDYLAPEQIVGETITPATDLYVLGVMLYEALSGHLPHETKDFQTLMRQRLTEPPPRIEVFVPDIPQHIADAVHALLAREPKERPQSAGELLERLRDRNAPAVVRGIFYGPRNAVDTRVQAIQEKRSMDLIGARGSGRTRTLQEVAAMLEEAGIDVVWTIPGKRPFSSLSTVITLPDDTNSRKLELNAARVDLELATILAQGCVIIADDESRLDRHSRAALERARSLGSVLRSFAVEYENAVVERDDAVVLEPWTELHVRELFVQGDRLFHLCEDAARELFMRTRGLPLRIFRELAAWERAGMVQKVGSQWLASREALDHLAAGRMVLPLPPKFAEDTHGVHVPSSPRGVEGRLLHLMISPSTDPLEIIKETLAIVEPLVLQGWLGQATALLLEGLRATRQRNTQCMDVGECRLLEWLVDLAIADGSPRVLDAALYELCRVTNSTPGVEALERLVRATLAMRTVAGNRAISLIDAIAPFSNPNLELRRQQVRVHAVRRCSLEEEQAVLDEAEGWARHADELARARFSGWLGRLRYRQGRFEEAAELHAQAAKGERWMTERIFALLNTASALLEAFQFDDAVHAADEARRLSAQCRHAYYEARAEWLMRTARYRRRDVLEVDEEFVDLVAKTGVLDLEALAGLTEAAIAWRRGDMDAAARLARRTEQRWTTLGKTWGALFARTLLIATTGATDDWERLVEAAMHSPVSGAGIQMLGLLGHAYPARARELVPALCTLRTAIPERHWPRRMDVLSVDEAGHWINDGSFYV